MGEQIYWTRSHLSKQLFTQAAGIQKGMDLDYETFFFFSSAKNRHDAGNPKPPGIPPCHLNIYRGACLHLMECPLITLWRRRRTDIKGLILLNATFQNEDKSVK